MRMLSPDEYAANSGAALEQNGFFEIEVARTVEQYGQIAHVFSTYESRRNASDAEPFARGINSFQLFNDGARWWVVTIYWQQESPAAPIPSKYLPRGGR
jgi:heme-degrading monooxygenase HmoA